MSAGPYLDAESAPEFGLLSPSEALREYGVAQVPQVCQQPLVQSLP